MPWAGPEGRENLLVYGNMVFNAMGPRNELLAKARPAWAR